MLLTTPVECAIIIFEEKQKTKESIGKTRKGDVLMSTKKIYRQTKRQYRDYFPIPENEGYTVIGSGACYNMRSYRIEIPEGVEVIEPYAFAGHDEACILILPSTLKKIGEGAFLDCVHLREIVVPEGVESIGDLAFYHCGKYVRGKFHLSVPDTIRTIGKNAHDTLTERGTPPSRPSFCATIRFCQNGTDEAFTLTELDPYVRKSAIGRLPNRPFVLLDVGEDYAVVYSTNDETTLVLPLGVPVHTETEHITGAYYEYTDATSTNRYSAEFTLTKLSHR